MSDLTGQFLGQYEILSRISKGATSTIYKAYQAKLNRFVAIKVLSPHVVDEEGFLDRFTQEARAVAQLDHPNIVPVYDFDQTGDLAYIVFKYVDSGTLRSMMTGAPLDLGLTVDLITQVGLALGYAHRRGVIHRDVKPSNVLIGEGSWALLTDFGLAKILSGGKQLTRTGVGMGTPDYMSPEQAQGLPGDGRSDLYSLGVTLYEMVTGRVPFEADSSMGVVVKHITECPTPPRELNPHLPEAVEKVILTVLEKDPSQRFQSAEAMIAALVRAAGPATEHLPATHPELVAVSIQRSIEAQSRYTIPTWQRIRETSLQTWKRIKAASAQTAKHLELTWRSFSRRQRMVIGGGAFGVIVLLLVIGSMIPLGPAHIPTATPTPSVRPITTVTTSLSSRIPTTTVAPMTGGTRTPTTPTKTTAAPSPTPEWTFLSPSAPIRSGIYVKIVRPFGLDISKEAGFEKEFITTLPVDNIVYVVEGPVRANSLNWIKVKDGATVGWGIQDYVVAYGIKNMP